MEYSSYQLRLRNRNLNLLVIYRLPTSSVINFGHELTTLIETNILNNRGDPLLTGDFNIHTDIPDDSDTINFNDFLDGLNLKNYIDFPTHRSHHTLDLILTDANSNLIHSVEQGFMLSDHYFIHCLLQQSKSRPTTEIVRYRKLKKIDKNKFATDVLQHFRLAETPNNLSDMLDHYNKTLTDLLETHAPVKEKSIKRTHNQPWFNDNIKCEIALQRKKEKSYIRDPTHYNFQAFYNQCRFVSNLIHASQCRYYCNKLIENKHNFKEIYTIANKLLFRKEPLPLPTSDDPIQFANEFNTYFIDKIEKIMAGLEPENPDTDINQDFIESDYMTDVRLGEFEWLDIEDITQLIKSAPNKTCGLDPIPTSIIKGDPEAFAPFLAKIVNCSLHNGSFTSELKQANVKPLLKKLGLTPDDKKKFRPVSNLSFVSKLIERAVSEQLNKHANKTGNLESFQSAYRENHSTETALLHVKTDLLNALDNKEITCLVLLDLSAAFDTIKIDYLLNRLHYHFGTTSMALKWFKEYLTDHTQEVLIPDSNKYNNSQCHSIRKTLKSGVPQGSVLGPILFSLFVSPIGNICQKHNIQFHNYADDNENYITFRPTVRGNEDEKIAQLEACISEIRLWMRTNFLKLNDNKTEVIMFGTRQNLTKVKNKQICVGDTLVEIVEHVRNLGYYMDKEFKSKIHINKTVSSCTYILRNIARV